MSEQHCRFTGRADFLRTAKPGDAYTEVFDTFVSTSIFACRLNGPNGDQGGAIRCYTTSFHEETVPDQPFYSFVTAEYGMVEFTNDIGRVVQLREVTTPRRTIRQEPAEELTPSGLTWAHDETLFSLL